MSDLPGWAKGEGEAPTEPTLADKLVDEAAGVKPEETAGTAPADTAGSTAGSDTPEDSGLASRALCFFRFLAVLTVLLALIVIGTNCYIIYDKYSEIKARGVLLRVYGILFSIFIIFAELEWAKFTKFFGFLKYWPARGLFYIFVGLITWDQTDSTSSSSYGTYEDIVSFLMMGVGGIYFLLGLACMRTVKEAERARLADENA
ncbi:unnamed protein product [Scytosiphon promiscuus]